MNAHTEPTFMAFADPVVIVGAVRTPIGSFRGALSRLSAPELAAASLRSLLAMIPRGAADIQEVILGCVLQAGLGQAPARQVVLKAGLPAGTSATLVNKVCGSGMKAIMMAHDQIMAEDALIVVAGGMESMSRAPHLDMEARGGTKFGSKVVLDHLQHDGLQDAYDKGVSMGILAERVAQAEGITKEQQDTFTLGSLTKAKHAQASGFFEAEIVPLHVSTPKGESSLDHDEELDKVNPDKIATLRPAFTPEGTITAASASGLGDGAAIVLMMRQSQARKLGLPILARIAGISTFAGDPATFVKAPIGAIQKLWKKTRWDPSSVDLYEINEAFALVPLLAQKYLNLNPETINVFGGATVMGHPLGASGARIVVTLINALSQLGKRRGIASICIGGGEAMAIALERPEDAT